MTDTELRVLCHRFFDAIERGDYGTVAQLYAPEFRMWANLTGTESGAEDSLAVLRDGAKLHRRRTYDDRIVNTFGNGFIVQYSVNVVTHTGAHRALSACVVAQCRGGRITRIDEYLDSGKFGQRPDERATSGGTQA